MTETKQTNSSSETINSGKQANPHKIDENYGERARKAAANEGIDWKAVSHAVRVCYEAIELLNTGNITFPLEQSILLDIKNGRLSYNKVADHLEDLLQQVKLANENTKLPKEIDREFWKQYIIDTYRKEVNNDC